jgi:hypothetical protein
MSERIFPYKTISGDLRLEINSVELDGVDPSPDPFNRDSRQLNLFDQERTDWSTVKMKLALQGPPEELRNLPNSDSLEATVVVQCDSTHERSAVPMKRGGGDAARWAAVIEVERQNFRGSARVEAVITGTAGDLPKRFLGASTYWTLNFDEPSISPKTGAIDVRWIDFKSPPDQERFLKDYANEPFYTDLANEKPIVYLNKSKDFERLPVILDDRRRNQRDLALHNSERTGIARSVWMALLNTSIAGIQPADDGVDPDWPELDWQRQVLKILLPKIYHADDAEALKIAFESWNSRQGAGLLESRGQAEINKRIGAAKLLRRTLNLLGNADEVRHE